jgi:biotin transport system substrate-specific component
MVDNPLSLWFNWKKAFKLYQGGFFMNNSKFSTREICYIGLFTAVIAVMAQISIPMPMGVPMTMQTFAITLAAVVLGSRLSACSTLIYLFLGAVGVPVLAGFTGGIDKFVGPTGGFLISFPIMAFIIGFGVEHRNAFKGEYTLMLILGTVINYVVGVALFCFVTKGSVLTGITACVLPFIPTAVIKAVLASVIGFAVRKGVMRGVAA